MCEGPSPSAIATLSAAVASAVTWGAGTIIGPAVASDGPTVAATATSEVKACANKKSGAMRLLTKGKCRKSERLVTWPGQRDSSGVIRVIDTHELPNRFGASGYEEIPPPDCPASHPTPVGGGYSAPEYPAINYLGFLMNKDGSPATSTYNAYGGKIPPVEFKPDVVDGSSAQRGSYPKDGPMTLHITQLCAAVD